MPARNEKSITNGPSFKHVVIAVNIVFEEQKNALLNLGKDCCVSYNNYVWYVNDIN